MADWFLTGSDMAFLTDNLVSWFAFGIGLGVVLWIVGFAVYWISMFVRY